MPIYEYRCESCEKVTEAIQKYTDPPLRKCPSCSGKLEKIISRTSFHLKGGGWYSEGYGTSEKGAKKPAESSTTTAGDSGKSKTETPGGGDDVKSSTKKAAASV